MGEPETTSAMPQVRAYPQCSECKVAYVLRLAFTFGVGGSEWVWQRDCKHKKAAPEVREFDGEGG